MEKQDEMNDWDLSFCGCGNLAEFLNCQFSEGNGLQRGLLAISNI